jgi:hypothetical protein
VIALHSAYPDRELLPSAWCKWRSPVRPAGMLPSPPPPAAGARTPGVVNDRPRRDDARRRRTRRRRKTPSCSLVVRAGSHGLPCTHRHRPRRLLVESPTYRGVILAAHRQACRRAASPGARCPDREGLAQAFYAPQARRAPDRGRTIPRRPMRRVPIGYGKCTRSRSEMAVRARWPERQASTGGQTTTLNRHTQSCATASSFCAGRLVPQAPSARHLCRSTRIGNRYSTCRRRRVVP